MDTQTYTELTGPNVWVGPEIQNDINWIHNLSAESIECVSSEFLAQSLI